MSSCVIVYVISFTSRTRLHPSPSHRPPDPASHTCLARMTRFTAMEMAEVSMATTGVRLTTLHDEATFTQLRSNPIRSYDSVNTYLYDRLQKSANGIEF